MMDRTDAHFRWLFRLISRRALLYSEMVTAKALLHGEPGRLLWHAPGEGPVALQLGGEDPGELARAAAIGVEHGYDEIDLNVGCPSARVTSGRFGACLMREPARVADCIAAIKARVPVPVTVKHRIGVDDRDAYEDLLGFVDAVARAGPARLSIHARKAWLHGLSPRENRELPPLRHAEVWRLKRERPALTIVINGGITTIDEALAQLTHVDGAMIGRAIWDAPFRWAAIDRRIFGDEHRPRRPEVVERYLEHARAALAAGHRPTPVLRPLLNLWAGEPGTRRFKQAVLAACADPQRLGSVARLAHELDDGARAA